jgi:hypothetical protein
MDRSGSRNGSGAAAPSDVGAVCIERKPDGQRSDCRHPSRLRRDVAARQRELRERDQRARERYVWLPPNVVNRLKAQRQPGESYSDVILRLAAEG